MGRKIVRAAGQGSNRNGIDKGRGAAYSLGPVIRMGRAFLVAVLALTGVGCQASRAWQELELPTHDRQKAFDAARETLEKHFGVAEASWAKGTVETRPQLFDRKREGTLADLRGAGGRWRRTVSCAIGRSGLSMVASVAVRLEREATVAAAVMTETGRPEGAERASGTAPGSSRAVARPEGLVWADAGYDEGLAREVLSEIAARVRELEQGEAVPEGPSPRDLVEEARQIGSEPGP